MVYVDGVIMLEGSLHAIKVNAEALVVGSKESGLEVNAYKTKYMVMSRDQNGGRSHSMKTDNSSFERFQIFGNNFNKSKFSSGGNKEQIEIRECLLSFGAESFVFQFAIQNFKD